MSTYIAATLTLFLLAVVVGLLQRHAEPRHTGAPHLPFGADSTQDADLRRVLHDLDGRRAA